MENVATGGMSSCIGAPLFHLSKVTHTCLASNLCPSQQFGPFNLAKYTSIKMERLSSCLLQKVTPHFDGRTQNYKGRSIKKHCQDQTTHFQTAFKGLLDDMFSGSA